MRNQDSIVAWGAVVRKASRGYSCLYAYSESTQRPRLGYHCDAMVRLRLKNPVPRRLVRHQPFPWMAADYPLKPRIHAATKRRFRLLCLQQKDGSFVATVLENPKIRAYDKSRNAAEKRATREFLKTPDPCAFTRHPLAKTRAVTVDMEFDGDADSFVTFVRELHGMSTYGRTEMEALANTVEMIHGYIKSMEVHGKKIPLPARKLAELKEIVGLS
jgi:predicted RNase H-like HicB family nuclease